MARPQEDRPLIEKENLLETPLLNQGGKNLDVQDVSLNSRRVVSYQTSLIEVADEKDEKMALSRQEKFRIYAALSIFSFGVGANEFSASGLLLDVADAFDISYTKAAYVQSVYALTVTTMGLPVTAALVNKPRKIALAGLMVLFVAGSITSALAPNYPMLMVGRILSALPHATFFGISSTTAGLMNPGQEATAIAIAYSGMTAANIIGTPGATWLGEQYGWRVPFWLLSGIGGCGFLIILASASALDKIPMRKAHLYEGLADLKKLDVLLGLLATAFGFGGMIAFSAYIGPIMIDVVGFGQSNLSWVMATFGTALCLGNYLGGKATDRDLIATLNGSLIGLAATLGGLVFVTQYSIPSVFGIFALGTFGFGTVPPLTKNVMKKGKEGSVLVSSSTNVAFNLGIAFSVWVTGIVIDAGYSYESAGWMGAILTTTGLMIAMVSNKFKLRDEPRQTAVLSKKRTSFYTTVTDWFGCCKKQNNPAKDSDSKEIGPYCQNI